MINKRKVRLMARTSMYEVHDGANDLPKAKYYKNDYVALHMWTTAVAVTVAYFVLLLLVVVCNFEFLINNLTELNYAVLLTILILSFVAMQVLFLIISYFVFSYRYVEAENGIKIYQSRLHKIFLLNKEDMKKKGGQTS